MYFNMPACIREKNAQNVIENVIENEIREQVQELVCILCDTATSISEAEHNCTVRNKSDISIKRNMTI